MTGKTILFVNSMVSGKSWTALQQVRYNRSICQDRYKRSSDQAVYRHHCYTRQKRWTDKEALRKSGSC